MRDVLRFKILKIIDKISYYLNNNFDNFFHSFLDKDQSIFSYLIKLVNKQTNRAKIGGGEKTLM